MKEIVLSGIRSTGNLHLGNYFGALRNFIKMQDENLCYFFIADLHSLTTHPDPVNFHENVKTVLAEYLASGLDPEKSVIFVQSSVPEVSELYTLMNMLAYVGELERTASFKEKVRKHPNNVNAGLLTYPVLMAADILIHRANKVPVGKDQEQHLEMTRVFARRFNNMYNVEFFPEPAAYNFGTELIKIPGLDGSGKMGKSEGNGIYLADDEKTIRKKVMRAVTDSGPAVPGAPMSEPVKNLFVILETVSDADTVSFFKDRYDAGEIRYGDLKKQLADDICKITLPIRERILEIRNNEKYLSETVRYGVAKARESAAATLAGVKEIMGFKSFY
ncbi:MAG: tryptophan--tRNA ligase [Prevotellaceae bacterium]|jgi:tryptophanyl-tRNA synthetase|nr:tryptophan--tRNA ligase [Prevotellaceae bacterium]